MIRGKLFLLAGFLLATLSGWQGKELSAPRDSRTIIDQPEDELLFGISGHPLNAVSYNANSSRVAGVSYDTQIEILKDLGLSVYRMDVATNASGRSINHKKFMTIMQKCQQAGITLLPMIYEKCNYDGTPEAAYRQGFAQMTGFAHLYGKYIDYFELGNEIELFDNLKTRGDGTRAEHYDLKKVAIAAQYIRGMEEGLKQVLPDAKSMVNTAGFFPVFWMDQMMAAAPSIDICAWHVYPEMLPLYKSKYGVDDIGSYLNERYGKPVWFTETNARADKRLNHEENEQKAFQWRREFTASCRTNSNIQAIIYHELLDNPERGGMDRQNFEEEHFGFIRFEGYPGKEDKAAYSAWLAKPERYSHWTYKKVAEDLAAEMQNEDTDL